MKRYLYVFIFALLFVVSCSKDPEPEGPVDVDPVQISLMYFAGLDLNRYYDINIAKAKSAVANGALGDHGVLYYFLPTKQSEATLFELLCEGGECVEREVKIYDDIASISSEAVTEVINDVKRDVGYESLLSDGNPEINLLWSSHATSWVLANDDISSKSGAQTFGVEGGSLRNFGVDEELIPTRYIGLESSSSEGVMDIEDLCQAIDESDTRFGYILFDACLLSSVEVMYRLRDCCDYVVASPAEILAAGFPYDVIVPELFDNNGTSYDLEGVCQVYYDNYSQSYGTVAMCVTAELDPLAEALADVTLAELSSSQRYSLQGYDGFEDHAFFDLGNYVEVAGADDEDLAAFQAQLDRAFPVECRFHTDKMVSNISQTRSSYVTVKSYSGVSTSQPSINTEYNRGWEDEPWAMAIGAR